MTKTIQIRKRGVLTLPSTFRKKYHLEEGDIVTLVDCGEGIFLSPRPSLLPKLVADFERICRKHGVSLEDLVKAVAEDRAKYGV